MKLGLGPLALALATCNVQASVTISSKPADAGSTVQGSAELAFAPVVEHPRYAPRRVLIVGDSEACAVRPYVQVEADRINDASGMPHDVVHVDCKGSTLISYWGTYGNLRRALHEFRDPDDVLVFLGTNHYWNTTAPNVDDILNVIKDDATWSGAGTCVWIGPTAVKGRSWPVNGLLRDAVSSQCSYFDTEAADIPLADGVHPAKPGAVQWIRSIWPLIPPKFEEHHA